MQFCWSFPPGHTFSVKRLQVLQGEGVSHMPVFRTQEAGCVDRAVLSTLSAECAQGFGDGFRLNVPLELSQSQRC